MQIVRNIFLVLLLIVTASFAFTQEQAEEQSQEQAQDQSQEQSQEQQQNSSQTNTGQSENAQESAEQGDAAPVAANDDTFVPSEEISEDLSVSFPVDI